MPDAPLRARLPVSAAPVHRSMPHGGQPVYQFHALFREFLLVKGKRRLQPDESQAALDRAAGQLVERGEFDAAAALYLEAQAWLGARSDSRFTPVRRCLPKDARARSRNGSPRCRPTCAQREPRLALVAASPSCTADPGRAKSCSTAAYAGFIAQQRCAADADDRGARGRLPLFRMGGLYAARSLDPRVRGATDAERAARRAVRCDACLFGVPDRASVPRARAPADRRGCRRGRATGRRRFGARRAVEFPAECRVDPVQLLQLEDEGRYCGCADRARHAVARRSRARRR